MVPNCEAQRAHLAQLVQQVVVNESEGWERAPERLTLACS